MITMGNWQQRMTEDMRLHDLRPRTIGGYTLAVRLFLERTGKAPEEATEEDVRQYVLHLRDVRVQASSSINIAVCALRFFFTHTLKREYEVFDLMRVNKPRTLPTVLGRDEVRRVLGAVEHPVRRVALTTIYALGLRIGEGLRLQSEHVQSDRGVVVIRNGKGGKDRTVPLPRPLLQRLRRHWKEERPACDGQLLFVGAKGAGIDETTLQKTFTAACADAKLGRRATRCPPNSVDSCASTSARSSPCCSGPRTNPSRCSVATRGISAETSARWACCTRGPAHSSGTRMCTFLCRAGGCRRADSGSPPGASKANPVSATSSRCEH
jgi:integrase/recombinase XerD